MSACAPKCWRRRFPSATIDAARCAYFARTWGLLDATNCWFTRSTPLGEAGSVPLQAITNETLVREIRLSISARSVGSRGKGESIKSGTGSRCRGTVGIPCFPFSSPRLSRGLFFVADTTEAMRCNEGGRQQRERLVGHTSVPIENAAEYPSTLKGTTTRDVAISTTTIPQLIDGSFLRYLRCRRENCQSRCRHARAW